MRRFFRDRGLTFVLVGLFLMTWFGQYVAGWRVEVQQQQESGQSPVSFVGYASSGHFWQATGENWESEFLQMATFVVLTCVLFQRGSPESRDPDEPNDPLDADPLEQRNNPRAPWPVRRGGWVLRVYENSLAICFLLMFIVSVTIHVLGGVRQYNEELAEHGKPPASTWKFMVSSEFWFQSFQNWQSEFLSLAAMVYLSVYLRQKGSAESKPVATPHDEQGD